MSKAVRTSLPILFVVAVYCGGAPAELLGPDSGGVALALWTVAVLGTDVVAAIVLYAKVRKTDGARALGAGEKMA